MKFDVISVRENVSNDGSMSVSTQNGTFVAKGISIKTLRSNAYGIREQLISGAPAWVESMRFDVSAKLLEMSPDDIRKLTRQQRRSMIVSLLESRFNLSAHFLKKELPIYELVVVNGASKLVSSIAPKPGESPRGMTVSANEIRGDSMLMSSLIYSLSGPSGRPIVDKTGLTGRYDINLKWANDSTSNEPTDGRNVSENSSIFTALQEQLGLRLRPAKGPVQILVVDKVEKPTAN